MMKINHMSHVTLGGVVVRPQGIYIKGGDKINKQYRINERQRLIILDRLNELKERYKYYELKPSEEKSLIDQLNKLIKKFTLSEE